MSDDLVREVFSLGREKPPYDAYGIELELESIMSIDSNSMVHLSVVTDDNSLRNSGYEFVSCPITFEETFEFYDEVMFGPHVSWTDKKQRCNERGSIHVHVNMAHRSVNEVLRFLRFYCMLEPQFFQEVADHRRNNIYCVPLSATRMPFYVQQKLFSFLPKAWHKYTALNVKPLETFGTVEFRHLQATEDRAEFVRWMNIIRNLQAEARRATTATLSWEELLQLHQRVFGKEATLLDDLSLTYQEDVLNRGLWTPTQLTQRIKESKQVCAV